MSKKRKALKISLLIVNILLLIGLGFTSVFYFMKYRNLQNTSQTDDQKLAKYEAEISKSFTLPKDEKATLGRFQNLDAMKKTNPTFFKDLADNDVLIIYDKAPLIVIYRPSTKKIINSAPLKFTSKVSVDVYGAKADRTAVDTILKQAFTATATISSDNDAKTPLTSTIVVDVTGSNAELATKIATEVKGKVGSIPSGEDQPAAGVGIAVYVAPVTP